MFGVRREKNLCEYGNLAPKYVGFTSDIWMSFAKLIDKTSESCKYKWYKTTQNHQYTHTHTSTLFSLALFYFVLFKVSFCDDLVLIFISIFLVNLLFFFFFLSLIFFFQFFVNFIFHFSLSVNCWYLISFHLILIFCSIYLVTNWDQEQRNKRRKNKHMQRLWCFFSWGFLHEIKINDLCKTTKDEFKDIHPHTWNQRSFYDEEKKT